MTLRVSADQGTVDSSTDSQAYADQYTNPANRALSARLAPKGPTETERAKGFTSPTGGRELLTNPASTYNGGRTNPSRETGGPTDSTLESFGSGGLPPQVRSGTQPESSVESAFRLNPFGNVSDEPLPSNVIQADSTPLRGSRAQRKQSSAQANGNGSRRTGR